MWRYIRWICGRTTAVHHAATSKVTIRAYCIYETGHPPGQNGTHRADLFVLLLHTQGQGCWAFSGHLRAFADLLSRDGCVFFPFQRVHPSALIRRRRTTTKRWKRARQLVRIGFRPKSFLELAGVERCRIIIRS
jgi:hypothetical protein